MEEFFYKIYYYFEFCKNRFLLFFTCDNICFVNDIFVIVLFKKDYYKDLIFKKMYLGYVLKIEFLILDNV